MYTAHGTLTWRLKGSKLLINTNTVNFSMIYVLYDSIQRYREEYNMTIPLPLAFNEVPSYINITVNSEEKPYKVLGANVTYVNETAHIFIPYVPKGKTITIIINMPKVEEVWTIIKSLTREVYINTSNQAIVIDHIKITNLGPKRATYVSLNLPLNSSIIEIKGPILYYSKRYTQGGYAVYEEENYVNLRIFPLAPPAYNELYEVTIKYKVPIKRQGDTFTIDVLRNPGTLVLNNTVRIYVLGSFTSVYPKPLREYQKGVYKVLEYKIACVENIEENKGELVFTNLRTNVIEYWYRVLKPYLFGLIIPLTVIIAISLVLYRRVIVKVTKPKLPYHVAKLCTQYIELLEEERKLVLKYIRREISRRTYRQQVELLRAKRNDIRKNIEELISEHASARKLMEKLYSLESSYREKLIELHKAKRTRIERINRELNEILNEMKALVERKG